MKENKGRFPWKSWAKFETVDKDGQVWQFSELPIFNTSDQTWDLRDAATNLNADCSRVGRSHPPEDAYKTLIARYQTEATSGEQADTTPDLLARVDRLTSRMDSAAEIIERHHEAIWDYRMRIEALENAIEMLLPGFYAMPETHLDDVMSFCADDETVTEPDPTAQKIEALKVLFPWRDECKFMTVDDRDGSVWQWSVQPEDKIKGDFWTALGRDAHAKRVGEILTDTELSKILIRRHEQ